MRPPKEPEQPVPVRSTDEQSRLLAACAGTGFAARRDAAMPMSLDDAVLVALTRQPVPTA